MVKPSDGLSSILVLLATLNEEEGVGPSLAELRTFLGDCRFLVVDCNSIDRTVNVAKKYGAEVIFQKGQGKGDAIGSEPKGSSALTSSCCARRESVRCRLLVAPNPEDIACLGHLPAPVVIFSWQNWRS